MKLTPHQIKQHKFKKALLGLDSSEVLVFLEELASSLQEAEKNNQELKQKVVILETQLQEAKSTEKVLQQTLAQAQEAVGKAVEAAKKESQLIIREAEGEASSIVDKARNNLLILKEQITIYQAKKESIIAHLKLLLKSELDMIKALETEQNLTAGNIGHSDSPGPKAKSEIDEILKILEQS